MNWLVAFAKIFIGLWAGSLSILADGIHSLFDGISNIVGVVGIKLAEQPKDEGHPYGHQKYEAFASLGILFLLMITIYELGGSIIQRFLNPISPQINFLVFVVLGVGLVIDYFIAKYEYSQGKKLKSVILRADSHHTKSHIFTTGAVIAGALAVRAGFPIVDPIIAIMVIFFIVKMAIGIFKEGSVVLCDASFVDVGKIKDIISKVEGVEGGHNIRSRGSDDHIFLDMHLVLAPEMPLREAHTISHRVKEKIQKEMPSVKDIIIHIEPKNNAGNCVCEKKQL